MHNGDIVETTERTISRRPGYVHKMEMRKVTRAGKTSIEVDLHTIRSMGKTFIDKLLKGVQDAERNRTA